MTIDRRHFLSATAALALPGLATAQATASGWPKQSIRFVVPFAPGGMSEIVARTVAHELTKQLGQTVFVDNKGGGAGIPAMQDVAKAAPDGHTIILGHVGSLAVNPYIFPNQPYDVNKDFIPVTLLAKVPNLFVVHPDVPAKDFKEFVAYVKKHPGQLNYGSAGNASAGHLAMEYLKLVTGMFMTHIPYRGTGPQLTDLLAGRTQASAAGLPAMLPHIKSGKLRAIAVGTPQRLAQKIIHALEQPFHLEADAPPVQVSVSIGIALHPEHGRDASTLLKHADMALYAAKGAGRRTYRLYGSPSESMGT